MCNTTIINRTYCEEKPNNRLNITVDDVCLRMPHNVYSYILLCYYISSVSVFKHFAPGAEPGGRAAPRSQ